MNERMQDVQQVNLWGQWEASLQAPAYDDIVKEEIESVRTRLKRTAEDIVAIGQSLITIKSRVGHGQFIPLLKAEFGMSVDSAQDFMRVARRFADKNWNFQHLPVSVLYELASPSVSDEIVERTIAGEIAPTVEAVRESKLEERLDFVVIDAVDTYSPLVTDVAVSVSDPLPTQEQKQSHVPIALQMSESNEWYTPSPYVNAARELMGGIDLDPASNPYANEKVVHAAHYYDIQTNGLDKEWHGRVWLNPPYGRDEGGSNQEAWSRRLIEQYEAGITKEAVLLVNAVTDRRWFQPLWRFPVCFTHHRIHFYNTEVESGQPTHGNALIYLGPQIDRFIDIFEQFGPIVGRLRKSA